MLTLRINLCNANKIGKEMIRIFHHLSPAEPEITEPHCQEFVYVLPSMGSSVHFTLFLCM